jgi:integrase
VHGQAFRPLFPSTWSVFVNIWERLRKALRLEMDPEFVPYCTRHTFATRLVQQGVRIEVLQRLMGHETISMTMRYAHVGAHQYVEAIKALERFSSAPVTEVTEQSPITRSAPAVTSHSVTD